MIVVILLMLIIAAWQIPRLLQDRSYKELFFFLTFWLISGVYAVITVMNINIISPFVIITELVSMVMKLLPF